MARALGVSGALWTCSCCLRGPNKAMKQSDYMEDGCVHTPVRASPAFVRS